MDFLRTLAKCSRKRLLAVIPLLTKAQLAILKEFALKLLQVLRTLAPRVYKRLKKYKQFLCTLAYRTFDRRHLYDYGRLLYKLLRLVVFTPLETL